MEEFDHARYLDVEGWDSSKPKFEPCDVGEVAGHYAYGSWQGYPVWRHQGEVGGVLALAPANYLKQDKARRTKTNPDEPKMNQNEPR